MCENTAGQMRRPALAFALITSRIATVKSRKAKHMDDFP
jgi:hypothetical protein